MKLRSIKIEKRFIPEWNKNRELPAAEQVIIYFKRIPGTSEKSNYKSFKVNQKSDIEMIYNDQIMIGGLVDRIENLEIETAGETKKIKTGLDLANANNSLLGNLFTEIRDYLFPDAEELTEGESEA
jgi:hypothetical protein